MTLNEQRNLSFIIPRNLEYITNGSRGVAFFIQVIRHLEKKNCLLCPKSITILRNYRQKCSTKSSVKCDTNQSLHRTLWEAGQKIMNLCQPPAQKQNKIFCLLPAPCTGIVEAQLYESQQKTSCNNYVQNKSHFLFSKNIW